MTRVLVVEDSRTQATQLAFVLGTERYEVEIAGDGREALERCRTQRFDVVLSDVVMPGMSGYELCQALKADAATRDLPVVLLTTLRDPVSVIEALESGADNFITKPYRPDAIVGRLEAILAQRRLRAGKGPDAPVEIDFMGKIFTISSGKDQILGLLIATFDDILRTNRELEENERERRRQGEQLARINQELEAFVYTVSHDLKEPLRGIEALSGFLLEDHARLLDDQGRHYLDLLRESAVRMTRLVDDLLRFARVGREQTPLVRVDLGALIDEVLREFHFSADGAEARIDVPPDLPTISGYPVLLRQLFANLVGNALKYHRPGVSPHVAIGCRVPSPQAVELTIADNGIGVPAEHRELVFGLFQRLHGREDYPGTGVGLALCKKIVAEHAGTIGIEETPGGGCTVRVILCAPLAHDDASTPAGGR